MSRAGGIPVVYGGEDVNFTPIQLTAATSQPVAAYTMSLHAGWRTPGGETGSRPVAGNLVVLCVEKPDLPVTGPAGWVQLTSRVFCKMAGPSEPDPVFSVRVPEGGEDEDILVEWEIRGFEVAGMRAFGEDPGAAWPVITAAGETEIGDWGGAVVIPLPDPERTEP